MSFVQQRPFNNGIARRQRNKEPDRVRTCMTACGLSKVVQSCKEGGAGSFGLTMILSTVRDLQVCE